MLLHGLEPSRVNLEGPIQRRLIPGLQRRAGEFPRHAVLPSAARAIGIRHVTRRLFQIGHQTAPLEHLREHVRDTLAGEVHAAELRNGIVAVFREHLGVQPFRAGDADLALDHGCAAEFAEKFVEKQSSQRLCRTRVSREERAFDRVGQVGQREDRAVQI
jgi:hypothetical protein